MYSTRPDRRWRGVALLAITLAVGVHRAPAAGPIEPPAELVSALATGVPESREGLRLLQQQVRRVVAAARPVTVAVEMDDSVGSGVIISADASC